MSEYAITGCDFYRITRDDGVEMAPRLHASSAADALTQFRSWLYENNPADMARTSSVAGDVLTVRGKTYTAVRMAPFQGESNHMCKDEHGEWVPCPPALCEANRLFEELRWWPTDAQADEIEREASQ